MCALALPLIVMLVLVYPTAWIFIASFRTPERMFAIGGWGVHPGQLH
jgi:ABC-type glycerol-3-phosphate transport system permease component